MLVTTFLLVVVTCLTSRAASAAPIILEVFYDAAGADGGQVFTEIYGEVGTALNGWSLVGVNGSDGPPYRTIDLTGAVIPARGVLVIAQASAEPPLAELTNFFANVDWQNGPDAVQLFNPLAMLTDALQYGDAGLHNGGEGAPALDVGPGLSLSRNQLGADSNNNFIDFSASVPSPGVGPSPPSPTPIPEPSTLALVCGSLVGCVARRRYSCGR